MVISDQLARESIGFGILSCTIQYGIMFRLCVESVGSMIRVLVCYHVEDSWVAWFWFGWLASKRAFLDGLNSDRNFPRKKLITDILFVFYFYLFSATGNLVVFKPCS